MEIKDIKRIIEMMKQNELTKFSLKEEGFELELKRGDGVEKQVVVSTPAAAPVAMPAVAAPAPAAAVPVAAPAGEAPAADEDAGLVDIESPIVGTFYRSSSPDTDPFVSVGQAVDEDTVVCIIEAMKVMNEIKAEKKGVIKKILCENATPVEFGQPLFKIEPA